jgi:protein-S-isoprenylcysteine O-methyltransferase Ste14
MKRTKLPIIGKSGRIKLLILNSTVLYSLSYFSIFLNPEHLLWINSLDLTAIKIIGLIIIALALVLGITSSINMKDSWRMGIRPEQKTDLIFLGIFLVFPTLVLLIFTTKKKLNLTMVIKKNKGILKQICITAP